MKTNRDEKERQKKRRWGRKNNSTRDQQKKYCQHRPEEGKREREKNRYVNEKRFCAGDSSSRITVLNFAWIRLFRRKQSNVVAWKCTEFHRLRILRFLHHAAKPAIITHFNNMENISDMNLQFVRILRFVIVENFTSACRRTNENNPKATGRRIQTCVCFSRTLLEWMALLRSRAIMKVKVFSAMEHVRPTAALFSMRKHLKWGKRRARR